MAPLAFSNGAMHRRGKEMRRATGAVGMILVRIETDSRAYRGAIAA